MSEPSVRETVARAVRETIRPNKRATWLDTADAALAAVADHDGLADVLRGVLTAHGADDAGGIHDWRCFLLDRYGPCTCLDELTKDLADVVRAWLRGES